MSLRGAVSAVPVGAARRADAIEEDWTASPAEIVIGKDVLELLSMSMYVDPLTIYREYLQNSADAIDEARRQGLLSADCAGQVDIDIDLNRRAIRIRDNGTGIRASKFVEQLTAVGASAKRGSRARGFRGVGRLAGLGYCQELVFRSRTAGETRVTELRWDCRRLQLALRDADFRGGLVDIIREVVSVRTAALDGYPKRFFEVELRGVVRHRNDRLLNPPAVAEYLSQVGPVPFAPNFRFGAEITAALSVERERLGNLQLAISGVDHLIFRPHQDHFEVSDGAFESFRDLDIHHIPGVDGGTAAIVWILHHGYTGAIPPKALIKGLRLRTGNIQVGPETLLEELFPEPRFNSWSVGEVHVLDGRLIPNGRRDHFQTNVHLTNLLNQLSPLAREIARRCRTNSIRRRWLRDFDQQSQTIQEKIGILKQGALGVRGREQVVRTARTALVTMEKIAAKSELSSEADLQARIEDDRNRLEKTLRRYTPAEPLAGLTPAKRKMYEHLFGLIYECSTNRVAAKILIDRILLKVG